MKIFVSYAHENTPYVLHLNQILQSHDIWFDQKVSVGQEWWEEIERQIASSHCFLFVLSVHSISSEYCQKELELALKLNKYIAPVRLDEATIPELLSKFQVIDGSYESYESSVILLNNLFEIERQVFNPLRPIPHQTYATKLSIADLYFATTNVRKKSMFEQILNVPLQTASIDLKDVQSPDAGEVAIQKVNQAFQTLLKPVFVEHSALVIRAWGGFPNGMTTPFVTTVGLNNICKMLQPFSDKYAEAISVIAFTDGQLVRKFTGILQGSIADKPRGNAYSWNNIFVPDNSTKTLGEMNHDEALSISTRRRSIIEFMKFLQYEYEIS